MEFDFSQQDGVTVARLSGRLTFNENSSFRELLNCLDEHSEPVRLDLSCVDFIDSAGLGMLLVLRDTHPQVDTLVTTPGQVSRLLQLACFSDFFQLH